MRYAINFTNQAALRVARRWQRAQMAPHSLKRLASSDRDVSPPPTKRKVPASTTSQAVANFFKPASARVQEPEKITFKILHDTLWTAKYNVDDVPLKTNTAAPLKLAIFDFDDTIVTTASGNKFSRDAQDWKWWNTVVPERLQALRDDGFRIVFMSNQAGVKLKQDPKTLKSDTRSLNNLKGKVTSVLTRLDMLILMYAATEHDIYRKPRPGMWQALLRDLQLSTADIDHANSFFVGDAAGREGDKSRGIKKDHSCSDRDFAANVNIKFHTPEEFFLDEPVQTFVRAFDPKTFLHDTTALTDVATVAWAKRNATEIVLFCGSPGAGKSTFYWKQLQPLGYERVNQDILKTRDRCLTAAVQYIEAGKSVAVDNTNADKEVRKAWVTLARKLNVPIRLVHFTAPAKLCEHNDAVRSLGGADNMNPEARKMLPKIAFTGFVGRYQPPQPDEGFEDIITVDFKLDGTNEQRELWSNYWVS